MEKNLQAEMIDRTSEIIEKRAALLNYALGVSNRKNDLETKRAELILSGAINGTNDKARDAQIRQMAEEEVEALFRAEQLYAQYQSAFDCAVYALDSVKYQIRLIEAMKP